MSRDSTALIDHFQVLYCTDRSHAGVQVLYWCLLLLSTTPVLSQKGPPPNTHSEGVVLVPAALSTAPGLFYKTPPPSIHFSGVVLVPAAPSRTSGLSHTTPPPSPHSAGVVLVPALLLTTTGLSARPHHQPTLCM